MPAHHCSVLSILEVSYQCQEKGRQLYREGFPIFQPVYLSAAFLGRLQDFRILSYQLPPSTRTKCGRGRSYGHIFVPWPGWDYSLPHQQRQSQNTGFIKKMDNCWHLRKGYLFTFEWLLNIITDVFDITIKPRRNNPFPKEV